MIRDNLFMLEIDPRCTQIAAFNLALAAWKAGGYRTLPAPNIACSGIPVEGQLDDWLQLAGDDERLRTALERLYDLFKQAPTLGSLINPADVPVDERMFSADYDEVAPLLEQALAARTNATTRPPPCWAMQRAACSRRPSCWQGSTRWWRRMCRIWARGKQDDTLQDYLSRSIS